jgi:preprotein translocase subunit SecD
VTSPYGFALIILIAVVVSVVVAMFFTKKNMY